MHGDQQVGVSLLSETQRWRNHHADAGQSETRNQLFMSEATKTCVEMTSLQGLADLERLEGYRQFCNRGSHN